MSRSGPRSVRARASGQGSRSGRAAGAGRRRPDGRGKRGEIGEAESVAADESRGTTVPGRRREVERGVATPCRWPTPARAPDPVSVSPPRAAASRTAASVLAEAADARATVVLSGHVQPDADALGSTLALAEGLRRRGARS